MRCWDELSVGTWTLHVSDESPTYATTFNSWTLRIWGTLDCPDLPGDLDRDCDVDLSDFSTFSICSRINT